MSVGRVKSLAAGFTALGLMTTGPLTGNALAEDASVVKASVVQENPVAQEDPIRKARKFAQEGDQNISVLVLYGLGNRTSPEAATQMVVDALEAAADRYQFAANIETELKRVSNFEGIGVVYGMGSSTIQADIRKAVEEPSAENPTVIADDVVAKRIDVNRTVDFALMQ